MNFRTQVHIPPATVNISHASKVMLFGSCFSDKIGEQLVDFLFQADVNPFGILYNPLSISTAIKRLLHNQSVTENDLVFHNELYHSLMHHGDFSHIDPCICLEKISNRMTKSTTQIKKTDFFLTTFGSAYVYKWKKTNEVAGNCHKIPADQFIRFRLTVDEIVAEWSSLIDDIRKINEKATFVFSVSPIRHWKDGAHENQLSKSVLHLAIDGLQSRFADVHYFPAYEILLDELRDYRFYAEDMMHPSSVAIQYIWERFSETYFNQQTKEINQNWLPILRALQHKPIHPETASHKAFLVETKKKMDTFFNKYKEITPSRSYHLAHFDQKRKAT